MPSADAVRALEDRAQRPAPVSTERRSVQLVVPADYGQASRSAKRKSPCPPDSALSSSSRDNVACILPKLTTRT